LTGHGLIFWARRIAAGLYRAEARPNRNAFRPDGDDPSREDPFDAAAAANS